MSFEFTLKKEHSEVMTPRMKISRKSMYWWCNSLSRCVFWVRFGVGPHFTTSLPSFVNGSSANFMSITC